MMNAQIIQAYESLTPVDQLIINTMISVLCKKDEQSRDLLRSYTLLHNKFNEMTELHKDDLAR